MMAEGEVVSTSEVLREQQEAAIRGALDLGLQAWRTTEARQRFFNADEALTTILVDLLTAEETATKAANDAGVALIRSLGFVGNTHYCADCMNTFHDDLGQHKPDCGILAGLLAELGDEDKERDE